MDNRFSIKDFFLFCLLFVVIIVVLLAMKQYDRQLEVLQSINKQIAEQKTDLAAIRRAAERTGFSFGTGGGNTTNPSGATTEPTGKSPFARVDVARQNRDYAMGDWYVDNFGAAVAKLTPLVSSDAYASIVQAKVLECMAYRDPDTLDYLPLLAQRWEISKDGMTITFWMRQGVTFSDGLPLTADDVVFSFDFLMNPEVAAPRQRAYFEKIERVEKINDYQVAFHFKEPYFESFDLAATMDIMPKHFYSKFKPEEFNQSVGLLMGSGQYRLNDPENWKPGTKIELVRNERYWGEPGSYDRLVYTEVSEDAAELTMFRNGETDVYGAQPDQYKQLVTEKEVTDANQHYEYETPTAGYVYIAWNQKRAGTTTRFADKRVRQAMTLLTDRQRVCNEVMLGYAAPATGPFHPLTKQKDPTLADWTFDVDKAKALLKEAGYEDRNGDGVLESAQGEPFRFKLSYPSGAAIYERAIFLLRDTYARAGVAMEPDPVDWPILVKQLDNRNFDAISLAWTGGIEGDLYQMFHSSQIKDGGDNFMSYESPDLDKLMEQARSSVDENLRMPLWHQCERILHDDQPYTFLFTRKSLIFINNRIHNVQRVKTGINASGRSVLPLEWYVPAGLQKYGK